MIRALAVAAVVAVIGSPGFARAEDGTTSDCKAATGDVAGCLEDTAGSIPDFDKIRTPDSPAFTLLGISPTQIERPTTPKQLTAALSGFLSDGASSVPKNLAVEFWPYWLGSSGTAAEEHQKRSPGAQLVQNITISIATAEAARTVEDLTAPMGMADVTDTRLALGARTSFDLFAKHVVDCSQADINDMVKIAGETAVTSSEEGKQQLRQLLDERTVLNERQNELEKSYQSHLDQVVAAAKEGGTQIAEGETLPDLDKDVVNRLALQEEIDDFNERAQKLNEVKQALVTEDIKKRLDQLCTDGSQEAKRGLTGALAVAWSDLYLEGDRSARHHADSAIWGTLAYETPGFSALAMARHTSRRVEGGRDKLFEGGARLVGSKGGYALSFEAVFRAPISTAPGSSEATTYRVAAAVDYHLQDNTWLTLSFGSESGQLFSLANIKFGFGDPKITPPSKTAADKAAAPAAGAPAT
jgi:hypothetical protein